MKSEFLFDNAGINLIIQKLVINIKAKVIKSGLVFILISV